MHRIRAAYIFPGQGLQYAGMAQSLVAHNKTAQELAKGIAYELTVSGYPWNVLEEMKSDRVDLPLNAQVAVYTHSVLAWAAFQDSLLSGATAIDVITTAGHSAGELAALVAAGALDPAAMARVMYRRSRLMDKAASGALLNIELGLDDVVSLINAFHQKINGETVYVSLVQGPSLTAVGGLLHDVELFSEFLSGHHINHRRVVGVTKPLHTPKQSELRSEFKAELDCLQFQPMHTPVISNTDAIPYDQHNIAETLASQLDSTVRFADVVKHINSLRPDYYVLFGPAEKLVELLSVYNGIAPELIRVVNTEADLREVVSEFSSSFSSQPVRRSQGVDLVSLVRSVLDQDQDDVHLVIDQLCRVRSVTDVLQDRYCLIVCKGSFNPIHNLHVELLRLVRSERRSSVALFALSSHTAKRELEPKELAHRIRWIHLAGFPVLLSRTGYFYKSFAYLKKMLPYKDIVFVVGSDVLVRLLDFFTPAEFGERLRGASFVCRVRGDVTELKNRVSAHPEYSCIKFLNAPPILDVSSSRIRSLKQMGEFEEIRRLMPSSAVDEYLSSPETLLPEL